MEIPRHMSQHTTKEILEMVAECLAETSDGFGHFDQAIFRNNLMNKAASLPEEKVERKKPENGEVYLIMAYNKAKYNFTPYEKTWENDEMDHHYWSYNRAYLMSERHLAEKKCAEVNKILNS